MIFLSCAGVSVAPTVVSAGTAGDMSPWPSAPWHWEQANRTKSCPPAATWGSTDALVVVVGGAGPPEPPALLLPIANPIAPAPSRATRGIVKTAIHPFMARTSTCDRSPPSVEARGTQSDEPWAPRSARPAGRAARLESCPGPAWEPRSERVGTGRGTRQRPPQRPPSARACRPESWASDRPHDGAAETATTECPRRLSRMAPRACAPGPTSGCTFVVSRKISADMGTHRSRQIIPAQSRRSTSRRADSIADSS